MSACILSLSLLCFGCASQPAPGSGNDVTLSNLNVTVTVSNSNLLLVKMRGTVVGDEPFEIRLPTRVPDISNPTAPRRVVTSELILGEYSGLNVKPIRESDAVVYRITSDNLTATPGERYFSFLCTIKGLVQELPDGGFGLDYDVFDGQSGITIRAATVTVMGQDTLHPDNEKPGLPTRVTCWLDAATICPISLDAPDLTIHESERLWGVFDVRDLTLNGSGHRDRLRLSLSFSAETSFNTEGIPKNALWKILTGIGIVAFLTLLTLRVAWRLFQGSDEMRNFIASYRARKKGKQNISVANALVRLAGTVVFAWLFGGIAMLASSAIIGMIISFGPAGDPGLFMILAYVGMLGGVAAPFFLFVILGIAFGAIYGGQTLNKYGFLISIPTVIWIFAGLLVCDRVFTYADPVGPLIASILGDFGFHISLEPIFPGWVYWAVMAVLISGWLILEFNRTASSSKQDTPSINVSMRADDEIRGDNQ
ncbi:MAG: hypothetical protein FWG40_12175 [Peptococcaceae bacterium]|nr:hypothetical protein [Peptococcaceae bacterium]